MMQKWLRINCNCKHISYNVSNIQVDTSCRTNFPYNRLCNAVCFGHFKVEEKAGGEGNRTHASSQPRYRGRLNVMKAAKKTINGNCTQWRAEKFTETRKNCWVDGKARKESNSCVLPIGVWLFQSFSFSFPLWLIFWRTSLINKTA